MSSWQRLAARLGYVGIILVATLANLRFSWDPAAAAARTFWAFAEPLSWSEAVDGLRNVVLFGGLGAVWVVSSAHLEERGATLRATLAGFALSVAIEGTQTFSLSRNASLLDVITDTLGVFLGALATAVVLRALRRRSGERSGLRVPELLVAISYVSATLCESLTPLFRSERLAGADQGPIERWHAALHASLPLSLAEVPMMDAALFVPAGFLAVMLLSDRARTARHAWMTAAFGAALLVAAAHLAHGIIGRPIRWEAVATDVAAIVAGAWAAHRSLGSMTSALRERGGGRAAVIAYGALLALWGWRPLLPETSLHAIAAKITPSSFVPLALLSEHQDVFSAAYVMQQALLYVPLGVLLARWPLSDRGRWSALRPALCLAVAIELGHLVVAGRTFDVTNILLACGGLGMGWIMIQRVRPAPAPEPTSPTPAD